MTHERIHLEMRFPDRGQAQPFLQELQSIPNLELVIVHGRVTEADARFELEVTGTSRRVAQAVRRTREAGVAVRAWAFA